MKVALRNGAVVNPDVARRVTSEVKLLLRGTLDGQFLIEKLFRHCHCGDEEFSHGELKKLAMFDLVSVGDNSFTVAQATKDVLLSLVSLEEARMQLYDSPFAPAVAKVAP